MTSKRSDIHHNLLSNLRALRFSTHKSLIMS